MTDAPRPRPRPRPGAGAATPAPAPTPGPEFESVTPIGAAPAPRWRMVAVATLAGLVLAAFIALDVWLAFVRSDNSDVERARVAAVQSVEQRVPAMLSYSYQKVDAFVASAPKNTTGPFKKAFTQLVSAVIAPAAKQQHITTKATVKSAGVIQAQPSRVVVLVLLDQLTTSKSTTTGRIDGSRVRVTMTRSGDSWLVSQLSTV